jgi:hypothetical protein
MLQLTRRSFRQSTASVDLASGPLFFSRLIRAREPQGSYFISHAIRGRLRSAGEMLLSSAPRGVRRLAATVQDAGHRLVVGPAWLSRRRRVDLLGQNAVVSRGRTAFEGSTHELHQRASYR